MSTTSIALRPREIRTSLALSRGSGTRPQAVAAISPIRENRLDHRFDPRPPWLLRGFVAALELYVTIRTEALPERSAAPPQGIRRIRQIERYSSLLSLDRVSGTLIDRYV